MMRIAVIVIQFIVIVSSYNMLKSNQAELQDLRTRLAEVKPCPQVADEYCLAWWFDNAHAQTKTYYRQRLCGKK